MLSYVIKSIISKRRLSLANPAETREKKSKRELATDLARADDDGFANAKEFQRFFTKESRWSMG